jgi:hypothetical protein
MRGEWIEPERLAAPVNDTRWGGGVKFELIQAWVQGSFTTKHTKRTKEKDGELEMPSPLIDADGR